MATTPTFNSTYAGSDISGYILRILTGNQTFSTRGIKIEDRIKKRKVIKRFTSTDIIQAATCVFTPTGTYVTTENYLDPEGFEVNGEICYDEFHDLWNANDDIAAGALNDNVPAEIFEAFNEEIIGQSATSAEILAWQGDTDITGTTYLNLIDGYEAQLEDGSPVSVTGATLTASNIVAALQALTGAQLKGIALKPAGEKVIFVSPATAQLYQDSLDAQGINTTQDEKALLYHGIEVRPVGGISENKMVLIMRSNMYLGTDLLSDLNNLQWLDMTKTTGDKTVRFLLEFRMDVSFGFIEEVVEWDAA